MRPFRGAAFCAAIGLLGAAGCHKDDEKTEKLPTYEISPQTEAAMNEIAAKFDVIARTPSGFEVVVPEGREGELNALAPDAKIAQEDINAPARLAAENYGIYDVASMERRLRDFASRFPDRVKLETYGTSQQGRLEYVMTMKGAQRAGFAKPELLITAATHGNEVITVEVALGLMEKLLNGYGRDARITRMLDNVVIKWVPAACVDGYANRSRHVQGQDPNRDYAWPEQPNREPQTQCIQHITELFHGLDNVKGTMDFHASGSMIMFPWAYTYDQIPSADYQVMDDLTRRMAEQNRFAHGPISRVIYIAQGSSADYYYWKQDTVSIAIEVSHNLAPAPTELSDIVDENTESTWRFIEHFIEAR